jgi:PAP2 superfamily
MSIDERRRQMAGALLALAMTPAAFAQGFRGGINEALGTRFSGSLNASGAPRTRRSRIRALDSLRNWHAIALDATGLDHTPVAAVESRVFGEQLGPGRSSRAMAIVHVAMFDAINAIAGGYRGFSGLAPAAPGTSADAAIAQAAYDTPAALFPSQGPAFDALLAEELAAIRDIAGKTSGIELGARSAAAILARGAADWSNHAEQYVGKEFIPSNEPGKWRPDPVSTIPIALGVRWGTVKPFVLSTPTQFRIPPPPPLDSPAYTKAFDEVKRLGGDGKTTPTVRTPDQTTAGIFWAYDGVPSLCAPPRLYNQIAMRIAEARGTNNVVELARMLALVNLAMADTGIACWESKYFYQVWRPVTGIREADAGTGPTGNGDGNAATLGDPTFAPLGAPASNLNGPNFTPPFPAYPSGHAAFGGALFQTLRNCYGTDRIAFDFVSDEFNGETEDNAGNIRPLVRRRFRSLSDAEEENGQSRIYLGIHWAFDKTEGVVQGRNVANFIFRNALKPLAGRSNGGNPRG